MLSMDLLMAFGALLQGTAAPTPDLIVITQDPVVMVDNYKLSLPSNCAGLPISSGCNATLVGFYYPAGMGPVSQGYSNSPSPVLIQLRGGNANPETPNQLEWFQTYVLPRGFVGIDPNYPPVLAGQDYSDSADDIAYLIQYLRYYHEWLNIDPDKIFAFGRSFGGIMSLSVGLQQDYQNLASADPIQHESSRPNFLMPFSAMTDATCLAPVISFQQYYELWFPLSAAPGSSLEQKQSDSAYWWLENPNVFARPNNPPMCFSYTLDPPATCGLVIEPHDSYFGDRMLLSIDEIAWSMQDADVGLQSRLLGDPDWLGFNDAMIAAMDWAEERLLPTNEDLYLIAPKNPIGPSGSIQEFRLVGAEPNSLIGFFFGTQTTPIFLPFCPNFQTVLLDYFPLGWKFSDAQGAISLPVFATPSAIGLSAIFQAADFFNCDISNLLVKTFAE